MLLQPVRRTGIRPHCTAVDSSHAILVIVQIPPSANQTIPRLPTMHPSASCILVSRVILHLFSFTN